MTFVNFIIQEKAFFQVRRKFNFNLKRMKALKLFSANCVRETIANSKLIFCSSVNYFEEESFFLFNIHTFWYKKKLIKLFNSIYHIIIIHYYKKNIRNNKLIYIIKLWERYTVYTLIHVYALREWKKSPIRLP